MTHFRTAGFALALVVALSACDASIESPETDAAADLTAEEVADATAIVAEAVAADGGGLIASAQDITAAVSASGISSDRGPVRHGNRDLRPPCRGDVSVTYDEETGTHQVGYRCGFQNANVTKGYQVRLNYRYRDAEGGFIARPWNDWDSVDSVAFGGSREGLVRKMRGDSLRSETRFEQDGRWALSQLSDDATPAILAGRQSRTGSHLRARADQQLSRTYSVELGSERIEIRESEDGLTHAASGEVAYVLTMEVLRNGTTTTRTVEGTVTLEGNGRALLRVFGLRNVYRVSLADGETDAAS